MIQNLITDLLGRKVTIPPDTVVVCDPEWKHPDTREIVGLFTHPRCVDQLVYVVVEDDFGKMNVHWINGLQLVPGENPPSAWEQNFTEEK